MLANAWAVGGHTIGQSEMVYVTKVQHLGHYIK